MGAYGRMPVPRSTNSERHKSPVERVPHVAPPFTLSQIKKAIPPHCFKRSLIRSSSYLAHDLLFAALFYYVAISYFHLLPKSLPYLAWTLYWVAQGCVCTGIWVIAHECGHQAFSDHQWVDDTIGFILHTALLVPYFSWKYSHRRHHSNIGSLDHDEVFVPKTKPKIPWYNKYLNNPPGRVLNILVTLTLGWPMYLAFNVSGRTYDRFTCHYYPYSPIYSNHERLQVFVSDVAIFIAIFVLYKLSVAKGLTWLLCVYGIPLLIVNGFLVLITYLHHTHRALPRYDSSEWDWLRGALATVDRDYGVLNKIFHNITDTHVVHHLFSTMPHYNAMEATKAVKPLLGDYYRFDRTPIFKAMWREAKECLYVEPDDHEDPNYKGVYWYKNKV